MVDKVQTLTNVNVPVANPHRWRLVRTVITQTALYGTLIFFALLSLLPFFWMISTSLMTGSDAQVGRLVPTTALQFQNYASAWNEGDFGKYFMNSVIIATVTLTGVVVTSVLAGYAFARIKFYGRNIIFTMLLATIMVPETVTLVPNYLIVRGNIFPLPFGDQAVWFVSGNSWYDLLAALTIPFMGSVFGIFLLRQFFATIPDELWEAARIDGAGHLRFLITICLPIARPAVMTVVLLGFVGSWNSFMWPIIITETDTWRPLMLALDNFVEDAGARTHLLMAGACITIAPILVIYFIAQKSFTQGVATSGLKG
ncbi:MAG: carbohydrate ABC transporter permease [Anaerolineae bacterium]|jgi:ABC-type glycerol-3-phosphate transport system permease component|nr:carbohydrate ABC transporter permease [Anaerolineae bacterium]